MGMALVAESGIEGYGIQWIRLSSWYLVDLTRSSNRLECRIGLAGKSSNANKALDVTRC